MRLFGDEAVAPEEVLAHPRHQAAQVTLVKLIEQLRACSNVNLEEVARAASQGTLRQPIARAVPLSEAIPALNDLESNRLGKRGRLVIVPD